MPVFIRSCFGITITLFSLWLFRIWFFTSLFFCLLPLMILLMLWRIWKVSCKHFDSSRARLTRCGWTTWNNGKKTTQSDVYDWDYRESQIAIIAYSKSRVIETFCHSTDLKKSIHLTTRASNENIFYFHFQECLFMLMAIIRDEKNNDDDNLKSISNVLPHSAICLGWRKISIVRIVDKFQRIVVRFYQFV